MSAKPEELLRNWPDGRIKMALTQRLLRFRNQHVDLFRRGNYLPMAAGGSFAESCVSFARELDRQWIVVIAPRLSSRVGFPPVGDLWKDTLVDLPEHLPLDNAREIFTNRELRIENRQLRLADAMSILPFAVITNVSL
jgi:(1->4)-alpha-D-glucan 1-alpha-D-glucosylmutase